MSDTLILIPARMASTRLPGKPLLDIAGKPMILHVVDRARQSRAQEVYVATDNAEIRQMLDQLGVRQRPFFPFLGPERSWSTCMK